MPINIVVENLLSKGEKIPKNEAQNYVKMRGYYYRKCGKNHVKMRQRISAGCNLVELKSCTKAGMRKRIAVIR